MAKTARVRRTPSRRAAVPVLPDDLVVWEILIRLPATALLRCCAVCRSWRRLTSAADFLLAHHRRQPSLPLVSYDGQFSSNTLEAFDFRRSPGELRPVFRFRLYNRFTVQASCDGLLLLSLSDGRFSICNPITQQSTVLPTSVAKGHDVAGLYLHSPSGEYRVLYWKWRNNHHRTVVYYVHTVGSSAKPRRIGLPVASPLTTKRFIKRALMCVEDQPAAMVRSGLHWGHDKLKNELIFFDTVAESFRSMRAPMNFFYDPDWSCLMEMDGFICISDRDTITLSVVDLWVLQDYEREIWSLKHRIELSVAELSSLANIDWSFNVFVVSDSGDVLVYSDSSRHLFHCKGKFGSGLPVGSCDCNASWMLLVQRKPCQAYIPSSRGKMMVLREAFLLDRAISRGPLGTGSKKTLSVIRSSREKDDCCVRLQPR